MIAVSPKVSGSLFYAGLLVLAVAIAFLISKFGLLVPVLIIGASIALWVTYLSFIKPYVGLLLVLNLALILPATRFTEAPLGLIIDGLLVISLLGSLFQLRKSDLSKFNSPIFYLTGLWFLYTILELFNPEVVSYTAWIYAIRNLILHYLIVVCIILTNFNTRKNFQTFLDLWMAGSILGATYCFKQHFFGLTPSEYAWAVASKTHIIFGQVRLFSFYSDAGVFGAVMGYTAIVATILIPSTASWSRKSFYIIAAAFSFYAMALSGTRGAIFVPIVGILVYLIFINNIKLLIVGLILGGGAFGLLKFTYIGEDNFSIRRMRSALNPSDDPSFIVRLNNQERMKEYMSTRPFGGGVGSMGFWGKRFAPGTFLGDMPPDSWYVWIWGENGVVGLVLYLGILGVIMAKGALNILTIKDKGLRIQLLSIFAGTVGIIVASYGNPLIGQIPCNFYFYFCTTYFFLCKYWDKELAEKTQTNNQITR